MTGYFGAAHIIVTVAIRITGQSNATAAKDNRLATIIHTLVCRTDFEIARIQGFTTPCKTYVRATKGRGHFKFNSVDINILMEYFPGTQIAVAIIIAKHHQAYTGAVDTAI